MKVKALFLVVLIWSIIGIDPALAKWQVVEEYEGQNLGHPASVAYDRVSQSLFVSRIGTGQEPTQKGGQGYISRINLIGDVEEERALPGKDQKLNKPKGVWVEGPRLWVTDIDTVWIFNPRTKGSRAVKLPGAQDVSDVIKIGNTLYVSDTTGHRIYRIQPADFLKNDPKVEVAVQRDTLYPNSLAVSNQGVLLAGDAPRVVPGMIYKLTENRLLPYTDYLGKIDGLAVLPDGSILYSEGQNKTLGLTNDTGYKVNLADGFGKPADFALIPVSKSFFVVVPDLATGQIRFLRIEDN